MKTRAYRHEFETYQTYMRDISKIPLLSHAQEIELSREVQVMIKLIEQEKLLTVNLKRPSLREEWAQNADLSIEELEKKLRTGERAKQKLIASNLKLVVSIAVKYKDRGLELLDLIQEGNIGLQKAVEKFDSTKGYRFSTYAYWWIRQGITGAIATQCHPIRLPFHVIETLNRVKKVRRELTHYLGYEPKLVEISRKLNLDPKKIANYVSMRQQLLSLNARLGEEDDTEIIEYLKKPELEGCTLQEIEYLSQKLEQLLLDLTPKQREVLLWRFGFKDGEEKSLAAIGRKFNISREGIRQLEKKGLKKLRSRNGQQKDLLVEIQDML